MSDSARGPAIPRPCGHLKYQHCECCGCTGATLAARDAELRDVRSELARVEEAFARSRREFVDALASAKYERLRLEADLRFGSVVVDEQMWTETRDAALRVPVLEAELEEVRQGFDDWKRDAEHFRARWQEEKARAEAAEAARREAEDERDRHRGGAEGYRATIERVKGALGLLGGGVGLPLDEHVRQAIQERDTARQSAERARAVVRALDEALADFVSLDHPEDCEFDTDGGQRDCPSCVAARVRSAAAPEGFRKLLGAIPDMPLTTDPAPVSAATVEEEP